MPLINKRGGRLCLVQKNAASASMQSVIRVPARAGTVIGAILTFIRRKAATNSNRSIKMTKGRPDGRPFVLRCACGFGKIEGVL